MEPPRSAAPASAATEDIPGGERLSARSIEAALSTCRLGRPTLFFELVGSTNDVAHEQAAAGAGDGLLVVADAQTAGRGRLDRRWWAPAGSALLLSLLLRPDVPVPRPGQLAMCLGLACCEAIEKLTGLRVSLKWPNDLLLGGRKLGGMLSELSFRADRLDYAVLGLGLNANMDFAALAQAGPQRPSDAGASTGNEGADEHETEEGSDWARSAISLRMALGAPVNRVALLAAILSCCEAWYDLLLGGASPHEAWAARLETLGRRVRVVTPAGASTGIATGITPEGGLLLETAPGAVRTLWSGDVVSLRAGK